MGLSKTEFANYIKEFRFSNLFNEMGWNNDNAALSVIIKDGTTTPSFSLRSVAEKNGFKVLLCEPDINGKIPDKTIRKKIELQVLKYLSFHIIIFIDNNKTEQIWQLVTRIPGKASKYNETFYNTNQDPQLLYVRANGLFFELDEEENITIVDVTKRVADNFLQNSEKITKKFYDRFKKEHTAFKKFIMGIDDIANTEWYASLMLNRLMFCYFIQKKGFLDSNLNYLKDKLDYCKTNHGSDQFYSFYKNFLLVLFHKGLGASDRDNTTLISEIGNVPYLNGGLFDEHEIEKDYSSIDIADEAFESVFNFFDEYEWHLDTRQNASGNEVNPDVIGYIFEKYINDRAQMGAYYTKEDITEYIGKNCIIPFLFDEVKRKYPNAFQFENELWQFLKNSGDKYIYDAVKKGCSLELPEEIKKGINPEIQNRLVKDVENKPPILLELRKEWNKPAPVEFALPTEIWREVVERRNRYFEVKEKIEYGQISSINDFITYNLNIIQFTLDYLEYTDDSDFIREFYKAIEKVTILDPTCGSGAFLFAALNILEPLYETCINRMCEFVENNNPHKHIYFEGILSKINNSIHNNRKYFIYKSIILRNLYGVDIMKEAVEIAKLRMFLKLVSTVDLDPSKPNSGLEPLPDIDFNIRSGNTLIGYVSKEEIIASINTALDFNKDIDKITEECDIVSSAFNRYKELQLGAGVDYLEFKDAKNDLNLKLMSLNNSLNRLLHDKRYSYLKYDEWLSSHKPFHWYAEFYEIINLHGGFDVIIGNPPYVVYTPTNFQYKLVGYKTIQCSNLYAACSERALDLGIENGKFGMILPNSSISADKLSVLQKYFLTNNLMWVSNFSWRPSKLFEGADMLLAISIVFKMESPKVYTTKYSKWYTEFRSSLFQTLSYTECTEIYIEGSIPKIPNKLFKEILKKMDNSSKSNLLKNQFCYYETEWYFYYFRAVQYWVKILEKEPFFLENGELQSTGEMKKIYSQNELDKYIDISILSSSLFFVHYITWSSCQVINSRDFKFPIFLQSLTDLGKQRLFNLGKQLQEDYLRNSHNIKRNYSKKGRNFTMEKQHFFIKKSKLIIDEIDLTLSKYYNFTEEELDFIINYDIKYRMGKDLEEDEE